MAVRILSILGVLATVIVLILLGLLATRAYMQNQIVKKSKSITENGGISIVEEIEIGGIQQSILIEGEDLNKPIVLFLHGGPGVPIPFGLSARTQFPEITKECIAVYYDQRGTGKNYHKTMDLQMMTMEQLTEDANEIVDYVRNKFNRDKILLFGTSFGTALGMELINRYPEKFAAYIGMAQIVDQAEAQSRAYEWMLQSAKDNNQQKQVEQLLSLGNAPFKGDKEDRFGKYIDQTTAYNYKDSDTKGPDLLALGKGVFITPDYSLSDLYKAFVSGAIFSMKKSGLMDEVIDTDYRRKISEVKVPVYFIQGKHDMVTNYDLAKEYYEQLYAPNGKTLITLEQSAHHPNEHDFHKIIETLTSILRTVDPIETAIYDQDTFIYEIEVDDPQSLNQVDLYGFAGVKNVQIDGSCIRIRTLRGIDNLDGIISFLMMKGIQVHRFHRNVG